MKSVMISLINCVAVFGLLSCGLNSNYRGMGSGDSTEKSGPTIGEADQASSTSIDPGEDREIYPTDEFDPSVTAVPPQVVTGAYLVCATVDQSNTSEMAEMPAGFPAEKQEVYSCGIQTTERKKHPAQALFQTLELTCAGDNSRWTPTMIAAAQSSSWGLFFEVPISRACTIESININVDINGSEVNLETKITDVKKSMPPPKYHVIFVTGAVHATGVAYPAGFNSVQAADQLCVDAAAKGSVTNFVSDWKAMISGKNVSVKDRINIYADVYNTKMDVVFTSGMIWSGLKANLYNENIISLALDDDIEDSKVWTSTKSDGTSSSSTCSDWSKGTDNIDAQAGDLSKFDSSAWISSDSIACDEKAHLYCISQFAPAP
jgi:hypothetical protein